MTTVVPGNPVVIQTVKECNGKQFANTWYFNFGVGVTAAQKISIGRDVLSPKLLAFERAVTSTFVAHLNHYIGDAIEQPKPAVGQVSDSLYERLVYNQMGTSAIIDTLNGLAPLAYAWRCRLDTVMQRPGFKYLRGWLADGHITPGGKYGAILTSPGDLASFNTTVQTALTSSGLRNHFEGGTAIADGTMCLAKYESADAPGTERRLIRVTLVEGMALTGITVRQTHRRGKRRAASQV